ncbi:hypothetical protein GGF31_006967 [Allomyces arbusculus]|nr:hypothetical protein GGF31_006967 [Allomyces arbusculus]
MTLPRRIVSIPARARAWIGSGKTRRKSIAARLATDWAYASAAAASAREMALVAPATDSMTWVGERADEPARQTAAKVPTLAYKSFKLLPPVNKLASATAATVPLVPDTTDPCDVAKAYLTDTLKFPENGWMIKNVVKTSAGVSAVYVWQLITGMRS